MPKTLEEALEHLTDDGALPLAGGQTLSPTMKARLAMPSKLAGLARIPDMAGLRVEDGAVCSAGAMTKRR